VQLMVGNKRKRTNGSTVRQIMELVAHTLNVRDLKRGVKNLLLTEAIHVQNALHPCSGVYHENLKQSISTAHREFHLWGIDVGE